MSDNLGIGSRIDHEKYGEGIISGTSLTAYEVVFINTTGEMQISKTSNFDVLEEAGTSSGGSEGGGGISVDDLEQLMVHVLDKYQGLQAEVELGDRWIGGTLNINPADEGLQSKEIPIEAFFHKIVMLRDRLRVLEQNINSHKKLDDEDKVHLQQYITRAYGSLTTFNVLFAEKDDYFKGAGK